MKPPVHPLARVVVFRPANLRAYEEVAEELRSRVRAGVRVFDPRASTPATLRAWLDEQQPHLVFAVGQSAYDVVRAAGGSWPVAAALIYRARVPEHAVVPSAIAPEAVLGAFRIARPALRRVGMIYGADTAHLLPQARQAAEKLGLELHAAAAATPAQAVARLRQLGPRVEAIWLPVDLKLLMPQVFHYALGLQFRLRIPVMGATRRHTEQGALFSLDHDPLEVGQRAAVLAGEILAGQEPTVAAPPAELCVNLTTAQRVRVDVRALRQRAAKVYQ